MSDLLHFQIDKIVLCETTKKGGVPKHHPRRKRIITHGMETEMVKTENPDVTKFVVSITHSQLTAKIEGTLNHAIGSVSFKVVDERVSSYLKKKRFRIMGYTPMVRKTNLNTPKE